MSSESFEVRTCENVHLKLGRTLMEHHHLKYITQIVAVMT